ASDNCSSAAVTCTSVQTTNLCTGSASDGTRTRIVTYTATDACGNSNVCRQVFIWTVDHTAPAFTKCPASINLGCNPLAIPDCNLDPTNVFATDCSAVVITCAKVDSTNGCDRTRTLTYTALDLCNNTNACSQVITWTIADAPPILTIVVQGTNVVISWPLTCVNFVLQQTPSLSPSTWTSSGLPAPVVVGNMN